MVINVGASAGTVGYSNCQFWSSDGCFCISHSELLNNKYLFYYLQTKTHFLQSQVRHAGIPTLDNLVVEKINLPIPSLEEQNRIVGILDTFTDSIENLKQQIAQRRKQYEHYRDQLLDLEGKEGVEMKTLGKITSFRNGKGHEKLVSPSGTYVVVTSKFISTNGEIKKFCNINLCPLIKDDILMVMSDLPNGKALAKCYLVECNNMYTLNQRIGAFHVFNPEYIDTHFLFFVLNRNRQLLCYDNGVDQTNLRKNDILSINIPVPPLSEQSRIVSILDTFEASISNLEAQLEQRQKQYEYYRNQLLTFE